MSGESYHYNNNPQQPICEPNYDMHDEYTFDHLNLGYTTPTPSDHVFTMTPQVQQNFGFSTNDQNYANSDGFMRYLTEVVYAVDQLEQKNNKEEEEEEDTEIDPAEILADEFLVESDEKMAENKQVTPEKQKPQFFNVPTPPKNLTVGEISPKKRKSYYYKKMSPLKPSNRGIFKNFSDKENEDTDYHSVIQKEITGVVVNYLKNMDTRPQLSYVDMKKIRQHVLWHYRSKEPPCDIQKFGRMLSSKMFIQSALNFLVQFNFVEEVIVKKKKCFRALEPLFIYNF